MADIPSKARKALLTIHLVVAGSFVGAAVAIAALGTLGLLGAKPATIYPAMHLIARTVLVPIAILALVSGIVQAVVTRYGLFEHGWVVAKLAITAVLAIVAFAAVVPALAATADAATAPERSVTGAQRIVSTLTPSVATLLLILTVALGVFKPMSRKKRHTVEPTAKEVA